MRILRLTNTSQNRVRENQRFFEPRIPVTVKANEEEFIRYEANVFLRVEILGNEEESVKDVEYKPVVFSCSACGKEYKTLTRLNNHKKTCKKFTEGFDIDEEVTEETPIEK